MKFEVLSVFDKALSAFGRPIFVPAVGVGIRAFGDEVNRVAEDNSLYKHPGDHELHHIGQWDDSNARFFSVSDSGSSVLLVRGSDVVVKS